jgi:hypothetical protein
METGGGRKETQQETGRQKEYLQQGRVGNIILVNEA